MKKNIIIVIMVVIGITWITSLIYLKNKNIKIEDEVAEELEYSETLDLEKIYNEVINLETKKIDFSSVYDIFSGENSLVPMGAIDINIGSFDEKGITENNFTYAYARLNKNGEGYLSFAEVENINKLDKEVKAFFKEKYNVQKYQKIKTGDIYIYMNFSDNEKGKEKVERASEKIFRADLKLSKKESCEKIKINTTDVKNISFVISTDENPDMYLIILPEKNKRKIVKQKIEDYFKNLINLDTNLDKIQNRLIKEKDGYLIYIISEDNEKIYNVIQKCKL